jgi:SAM-dependent methyltransferase
VVIKALVRSVLPRRFIERARRIMRRRQQELNRSRTAEEVFTDIYQNNRWGGAAGEFCSGSGTTEAPIVSPYIAMVSELAFSEGFVGRRFVDLGCGDFRVGRLLQRLCASYTGVDVVGPLVQMNQDKYGSETTRFLHLDIVNAALPEGDVCFLRQVLQHLSNRQIAAVLPKLAAYQWVFITEHYPTDNGLIEANKDKVHGGDIRLYENSGVYLAEPPFRLPQRALRQVLEVPGNAIEEGRDGGVIRTFLYEPGGRLDHVNGEPTSAPQDPA